METGFVKLPRSLINAEWAKNPATLTVFVHLLSKANIEAREWQGRKIPRGAAVISQRSLAKECGITPRAARTALQKLCAQNIAQIVAQPNMGTNAHQGAHQCTIVIICEYDSYSGSGKPQRAPQRAPNTTRAAQLTAQDSALPKEINKEYKDYIEIYIEIFGEERRLLPILEDWIAYKKEKGQAYKGRKGITQFCNRLKDLSNGNPETARQIVNESMAANWANIFPLKGGGAPAPKTINTNPRINIEKDTPEEGYSTI